jgi:cold shock CspA family protein
MSGTQPKQQSEGFLKNGGNMKGKIKFYDAEKRYGFIIGSERDFFFCHAGVVDGNPVPLKKNECVSFDISNTARGPRAESIKRLADNKEG